MTRIILVTAIYASIACAQDLESDFYCDEYFTSCNSTEVGCPGNTRQCSLEITSTIDKRRLAFRILCDGQVLALGQSIRTKDLTSLFSKTCTISAENNKRLFDIVSNRIAILVD